MKQAQRIVQELLELADVRVAGDRPWDIRVSERDFFQRVLASGSIGLGDSYIDGWWQCEALDEFFFRILRVDLTRIVRKWPRVWAAALISTMRSKMLPPRRFAVAERHYDLGNDLFQAMLDQRMTYSCAYWREATNLDAAQEAKLALVCDKIGAGHGMRVLDIGCGWGSFAGYAAEKWDLEVIGITISREQAEWAMQQTAGLGVRILLQDYLDASGRFDRIVSIGMFEHVGVAAYRRFFEKIDTLLEPDGIFVLHTIANNRTEETDPWLKKHIFPESRTPSLAQIARAVEGLFVVEDVHNIGPHYDPTCMAWYANFRSAWPRLQSVYGPAFKRKWEYYLQMAAGNFRARASQVLQIVLARTNPLPPPSCPRR